MDVLAELQRLGSPVRLSLRDLVEASQPRTAALQWSRQRLQRLVNLGEEVAMDHVLDDELGECFAAWGLCGGTDGLRMVQGDATEAAQLEFWRLLVGVLDISTNGMGRLQEQLRKDLVLLDVVASENQSELFCEDATLLPPDIAKRCPPSDPHARASSILQQQAEALNLEMERTSRLLEETKAQALPTQASQPVDLRHSAKALEVSVNTLAQLASDFVRVYEAELASTINSVQQALRSSTSRDTLGRQCATALRNAEALSQVLEAAHSLQSSYKNLVQKQYAKPMPAAVGTEAVASFEQFMSVTQQSLARLQR